MYARVDDVLRKSEEELLELKALGLCDLHIGVESGSDSILLMMNKGVTSYDTITALKRLDKVGIGYYVTVILGLGAKPSATFTPLKQPVCSTRCIQSTFGAWPLPCGPKRPCIKWCSGASTMSFPPGKFCWKRGFWWKT